MPDRSFLAWPFLDDGHRVRAAALEGWAARHLPRFAEPAPDDPYGDAAVRALVPLLAEAGFLDACLALDVRMLCLTRETLARFSGLADFAFAMQGLGSGPVSLFGTPAQKALLLPAVRAGQAITAFALSEPEAGSDVAALATTARRDGDAFVLDGEKTWISNGGIATHYVVFARTGEAPGAKGLSAFLVDAATPGLSVAERIPVIAPHPLARLRFAGARVPADRLIGAPGQGFKIAMATLDVFRSTVGAAALGFARRALDEALARASTRQLFGAPMAELQLVQGKIATMATEVDAAALLVYRAAWAKDSGAPRITREAAMAKLYATEAAQRVIDDAVQIFGGHGVVSGNPVERLYREIRALRIYEGASEVQQVIVARQALADFASARHLVTRSTGGMP